MPVQVPQKQVSAHFSTQKLSTKTISDGLGPPTKSNGIPTPLTPCITILKSAGLVDVHWPYWFDGYVMPFDNPTGTQILVQVFPMGEFTTNVARLVKLSGSLP